MKMFSLLPLPSSLRSKGFIYMPQIIFLEDEELEDCVRKHSCFYKKADEF